MIIPYTVEGQGALIQTLNLSELQQALSTGGGGNLEIVMPDGTAVTEGGAVQIHIDNVEPKDHNAEGVSISGTSQKRVHETKLCSDLSTLISCDSSRVNCISLATATREK